MIMNKTLLALLLPCCVALAQTKKPTAVMAQKPAQKISVHQIPTQPKPKYLYKRPSDVFKKVVVNLPVKVITLPTKPQGEDLSKYLKGRTVVRQSVDTSGCLLTYYDDGLIKRACGKDLASVRTPDGVEHFPPPKTILYSMTYTVCPPNNLPSTDPMLDWLKRYNESLLTFINQLLGGDAQAVKNYQTTEDKVVKAHQSSPQNAQGNYLFERMAFRSDFIEKMANSR